jgi:hypothetical protein
VCQDRKDQKHNFSKCDKNVALLTQEKDNQPQSKDECKSDRNNNERDSQNVQEKVKKCQENKRLQYSLKRK